MSLLSPVPRKATATRSGLVRTDVLEITPVVTTLATHAADVASLEAGVAAAAASAESAGSDATAALSAANAAVAAADSFPIADFLGTISSLSQDPGAPGVNEGKWWAIGVTGTLTHPNADSAAVQTGERLLAAGSGWNVYPVPPTYVPDSSLVKVKLAPAIQTTLTIANAAASHWMVPTTAVGGVASPSAGNAEGSENTTRVCGEPISATGTITRVQWWASVIGTFSIRIYSKAGSVLTLEASHTVVVSGVGVQDSGNISLDVEAGWLIGIYSAVGRLNQENGVSGTSMWRYDGDASSAATFTELPSVQLQIGWELLTAIPQLPSTFEVPRIQLDHSARESLDLGDWLVGEIVQIDDITQGVQSPAYEVDTSLETTRLYGAPVSVTGTMTSVVLYANNAGTMEIRVYSRAGSTFTVEQAHAVTCTEGVNTFAQLSIPVVAGQFVGVYAATAGLGQLNSGTGEDIWTCPGAASPSGTFTLFPTVAPQIGWTVTVKTLDLPVVDVPDPGTIEVIQSTTQIRVFVPSLAGACVEYVLRHFTSGPSQSVWRVSACYICTRTSAHNYTRDRFGGSPVVDDGAWEFAAKVTGDADYVGTWHSYETLSSALHFRDGTRIQAGTGNHTCKSWEFVQRSTVFRYGTTTVLAYRTMRMEFTIAGIRCRQQVEWQAAVGIDHAYLGMVPIKRHLDYTDTESDLITDTAITAPACVVQDIGVYPYSEIHATAGDFVRMWGSTSGVAVRFDVMEWPTESHVLRINSSPYYNKIYADSPAATVTASSVWKSDWTVSIETTLA